jgi:hypothetical protein
MRAIDWEDIVAQLNRKGYAVADEILSVQDTKDFIEIYEEGRGFYTHDDMRHLEKNATEAEYRHFGSGDAENPQDMEVMALVANFREQLYTNLRDISEAWEEAKAQISGAKDERQVFPKEYADFQEHMAEHGLTHPFSAIIQYHEGRGHPLHQDQYNRPVVFPFQMCFLLNDENDFSDGHFLVAEEGQDVVKVTLKRGSVVVFPSAYRILNMGTDLQTMRDVKHGVEPIISNIGTENVCRTTLAIGCNNRVAPEVYASLEGKTKAA